MSLGKRARAAAALALTLGASALVFGCSSVPSFPPNPVDAGIECDDENPCGSSQVCLLGRCYASCDAMHACGVLESCMAGICVARVAGTDAGPHDGGPDVGVDSGMIDPCAGVRCVAPMTCRAGSCVECTTGTDCGGAVPVCDFGRGRCVAYSPAPCAPCNNDFDCRDAGGTSYGSCVTRVAPAAMERVCLPSCATDACPSGFSCDSTTMHCEPTAFSCTAYLAAATHRTCADDSECAQIGATIDDGLVPGSCRDDGGGMICHYPCGLPSDCPPGLSCQPDNFCL